MQTRMPRPPVHPADQSFSCSLMETLDAVGYINVQQTPISDCADPGGSGSLHFEVTPNHVFL